MLQLGRKDDVTENHTRTRRDARREDRRTTGLDPASLRDLAAGGLLHDIGKLHTPDSILNKPGKLTDAEYEVIKRHPADGQRMLREVDASTNESSTSSKPTTNGSTVAATRSHRRRPHRARSPHPLRRRRVRRAHLAPPLPPRMAARPRPRGDRTRDRPMPSTPSGVAALRAIVAPGRYVPKALAPQVTRAKQRRLA